ncbi:unnamed protein product [Eretmochelys imbricata]
MAFGNEETNEESDIGVGFRIQPKQQPGPGLSLGPTVPMEQIAPSSRSPWRMIPLVCLRNTFREGLCMNARQLLPRQRANLTETLRWLQCSPGQEGSSQLLTRTLFSPG